MPVPPGAATRWSSIWCEFHPELAGASTLWAFVALRMRAGFSPAMLPMTGFFALLSVAHGVAIAFGLHVLARRQQQVDQLQADTAASGIRRTRNRPAHCGPSDIGGLTDRERDRVVSPSRDQPVVNEKAIPNMRSPVDQPPPIMPVPERLVIMEPAPGVPPATRVPPIIIPLDRSII